MVERATVDVSDIFWRFVVDTTNLSYEQLYLTDGFAVLSDACGRLTLRCETLGAISGLVDGVTHDEAGAVYVFEDVSSLLRDTPTMVLDPLRREQLESCMRRITCFVDVSDLATDVERQTQLVP